jgi:NADP-dependent 3-hydroxy acid dehydrogenase YdfG
LTGALDGVRIVITGAGRGLGAAMAHVFAERGAKLILCGRSLHALAAVADTIAANGRARPDVVRLDLAEAGSVEGAAHEIREIAPTLDVLINNGATWLEHRASAYPAAEVSAAVNSAVTGTFLLTQALLPALSKSSRPDIVTIGSRNGLPNAPLDNLSIPFYAAKHAQLGMAEGLRQLLKGTPIRSIAVHPPPLEDVSPPDAAWNAAPNRAKGMLATNRDVVEAVEFAITRPRHVTISSLVIDSDAGAP